MGQQSLQSREHKAAESGLLLSEPVRILIMATLCDPRAGAAEMGW